ncbi:hypothetical protein I7I48_06733 [Histoplasma ohiense]|nr:hypothetical protein I7I48_06733 [Histoplasma ohiense (nom. inval.)]
MVIIFINCYFYQEKGYHLHPSTYRAATIASAAAAPPIAQLTFPVAFGAAFGGTLASFSIPAVAVIAANAVAICDPVNLVEISPFTLPDSTFNVQSATVVPPREQAASMNLE